MSAKKTGKKGKEPRKSEKEQIPQSAQPSQEQELIEDLQRLQAEFENFKKRTEQERTRDCQRAEARIFSELLAILDNFELALKSHESKDEPFYRGIEMLYAQIVELLKQHGVESMDALNQPFNPELHEAMMTEQRADREPNTIIEVLQRGFTINGRPLRTAKVKVSK